MEKTLRIYNGADYCCIGGLGCPVVDYCKSEKKVIVSDSSKPENGHFVMTVEEYNALVENAKPIKLNEFSN